MKKIKPIDLVSIFEAYKGKRFVHLRTSTVPSLTKKGRTTKKTFSEVFNADSSSLMKVSDFKAGLGYDYTSLVHNRLAKEDKPPETYEAGTSWHIPFNGSSVIRCHKSNKDALYFYVSLISTQKNPPKTEYMINGVSLASEQVKILKEEFLSKPAPDISTRQGIENPKFTVNVRVLKLDSVKYLKADGVEYKIA